MTSFQEVLSRSFTAEVSLATKQFYAVKLGSGTDDNVDLAGAGEAVIGVVQNNPAITEQADVMLLGTTKIVAGAAITKGAYVKSDSAGKAVATTTDRDKSFGRALTTAGADGDIIEIILTPGQERSTA